MFLAFGILAALEARHRTGRGQYVGDLAAGGGDVVLRLRGGALFPPPVSGHRGIGQAHRGSAPYQVLRHRKMASITIGAYAAKSSSRGCAICWNCRR